MDPEQCTLDTCSIEDAYIHYQPSIAANSVFIALFGLLLVGQAILTPVYRMWGFSVSMILGLILEVIGYAARVLFHDDPFNFDYFLMNLISLSLGPVFFCAAIYFLLGRIVIVYHGEDISRLKPKTYAISFVSCDIIALIMQSAGGAITSAAEDTDTQDIGVNVMIAGLAFQVAALTVFIALATEFAFRLHRRSGRGVRPVSSETGKDEYLHIRERMFWTVFLVALVIAVITVYTRSIFRVIELNGGYDSAVANDEIAFMILEAAMVGITCICMTVLHPGIALKTREQRKDLELLGEVEMS
ncbi:RTA1 like protein-domain-containing protein [Aspergillus venezuelensis]